ncbi:MAG: alpha-ketoacid dehydrogenase subunit beta [Methanomassiliicoccaceae archaeon]|jgi:pyruvate dehydrogenase E1 component beta subunit|nr:alpha-ketoacid dehydrogenase subunit beta [Methanomassiliicoccaceae archaeon]HQA20972.1 alpha-ketoacid dehydrogenase subunit beta [Methanomassiliicoccaceae archaeon]
MMMNMVQAINSALAVEMEADGSVVVLGEDVGAVGGVFRATDGLMKRFGSERVIDTPLAESLIAGMATGMAMAGLRPVAEIQFMGFSYLALNMIISHTARMRNRSRGTYTVPMVMRMPYGAGVKALEHHSESTESMFVQIPGIKVVVPSTPREAKGLLISSIRDPDPVIFLEPTRSYRLFKEEVEEGAFTIPLGEARTVREGDDVTVVCWGAMMPLTMEAVDAAEGEGISCDVIDLRTLSPMDPDAVIRSVRRTGRVVIVQEAPMTCGLAAEIIARINKKAFLSLEAPPERVTAPDITVPLPQGENHYYISPDRIYHAIRRTASF